MAADRAAHIKAMVLLNATCLLWAGNLLFGRMLRESIGPLFIVAVRTLVGSLVFAAVIWFFGRRDLYKRITDWPAVLGMGLCGVILFQVMFYYGLRYTTVFNASIINSFIPMATALLALIFFGERLRWNQWLAVLVTMIGIGWIMGKGSVEALLALRFNIGDWLILGAVFSWAIYGMLGKRLMGQLTAMEVTALGMFVALLPVLPLAVWESTLITPHIDSFVVFALAFICIGPTILCLFWWNRGVQLIGPAHASIYMNLIPIYAGVMSYFFLGEPLGQYHLVGGAMVVGASFYVGLSAIRRGQS